MIFGLTYKFILVAVLHFSRMRKVLINFYAQPITVIDTYLASEGFIAYQQRPETTAMKLVTDNGIYFEFVPFKPEYVNKDGSITQDAPVINLSEVKKDHRLCVDYEFSFRSLALFNW